MEIEYYSKVPAYGKELADLKRGFWQTMALVGAVEIIWFIIL